MKADKYRHLEYDTQLDCILCGRAIVVIRHRNPLLPLGGFPQPMRVCGDPFAAIVEADVFDVRCNQCGGTPIRGETTSLYVVDKPADINWWPNGKPKRGRPPKVRAAI